MALNTIRLNEPVPLNGLGKCVDLRRKLIDRLKCSFEMTLPNSPSQFSIVFELESWRQRSPTGASLDEDPVEVSAQSWVNNARTFSEVEEGVAFQLRFPSG